jgi:hypothetical protein
VNLRLDPLAFSEPLRFVWFLSEEGSNWQAALDIQLRKNQIEGLEADMVRAAVEQTISRVGIEKFRRHFDIRPISQGKHQGLIELRWKVEVAGHAYHWRLYATLLTQDSLLVGLCFRQKVIIPDDSQTKYFQNQDILHALKLLGALKSQPDLLK